MRISNLNRTGYKLEIRIEIQNWNRLSFFEKKAGTGSKVLSLDDPFLSLECKKCCKRYFLIFFFAHFLNAAVNILDLCTYLNNSYNLYTLVYKYLSISLGHKWNLYLDNGEGSKNSM